MYNASYSNANNSAISDQERHSKISELQREIMMTEADLKKFVNEKSMLETNQRRIKKEMDILRMEMQENEKRTRFSEQNINIKKAEIMRLKKILNVT